MSKPTSKMIRDSLVRAAADAAARLETLEAELATLRKRVEIETSRADYWHACAVNLAPTIAQQAQQAERRRRSAKH